MFLYKYYLSHNKLNPNPKPVKFFFFLRKYTKITVVDSLASSSCALYLFEVEEANAREAREQSSDQPCVVLALKNAFIFSLSIKKFKKNNCIPKVTLRHNLFRRLYSTQQKSATDTLLIAFLS